MERGQACVENTPSWRCWTSLSGPDRPTRVPPKSAFWLEGYSWKWVFTRVSFCVEGNLQPRTGLKSDSAPRISHGELLRIGR